MRLAQCHTVLRPVRLSPQAVSPQAVCSPPGWTLPLLLCVLGLKDPWVSPSCRYIDAQVIKQAAIPAERGNEMNRAPASQVALGSTGDCRVPLPARKEAGLEGAERRPWLLPFTPQTVLSSGLLPPPPAAEHRLEGLPRGDRLRTEPAGLHGGGRGHTQSPPRSLYPAPPAPPAPP